MTRCLKHQLASLLKSIYLRFRSARCTAPVVRRGIPIEARNSDIWLTRESATSVATFAYSGVAASPTP